MFINGALELFKKNSIFAFFKDSLIFKYSDGISFAFLIATILSTAFLSSTYIGILAIMFVLSVLFKFLMSDNEKINISFLNKILIIYFLFVLISQAGASLFFLSLKGFFKTIIHLLFYFSAAYFLHRNKNKIPFVLLTIAFLISTESIIAILQNVRGVEAIATWQDTKNVSDATKIIARAYGTLKPYNPNLLAGYLLAGVSSLFAFMCFSYTKKDYLQTSVFGALFLVVFYAIFTTGSRGAYLGLFGIMLTFFCFVVYFAKKRFGSFKNIKTSYKIAFSSVVAAIIGGVCLVPSFFERILSIFSFRNDSSISFRMNVYEASLRMFQDNPFLGVGVGNKNFREIYGLYMKTGFDALGTYSVPLEIAVESGIFAFLSFFTFIILTCIRCVKYTVIRKIHPYKKIVIFSVLLTIIATMFHGFFDTIFFRPQIQMLFWVNIAIFHALAQKDKFC